MHRVRVKHANDGSRFPVNDRRMGSQDAVRIGMFCRRYTLNIFCSYP